MLFFNRVGIFSSKKENYLFSGQTEGQINSLVEYHDPKDDVTGTTKPFWTGSKATFRKLLRDGVERIWAFPSASILSWTELNWPMDSILASVPWLSKTAQADGWRAKIYKLRVYRQLLKRKLQGKRGRNRRANSLEQYDNPNETPAGKGAQRINLNTQAVIA